MILNFEGVICWFEGIRYLLDLMTSFCREVQEGSWFFSLKITVDKRKFFATIFVLIIAP